nr:uncharacterized protein LOC117610209 isoform X3 [Osmia lignaria]XP_034193200.1 uncharacterized protein LOC117610209 isoform X3 [Osmia lignaria]
MDAQRDPYVSYTSIKMTQYMVPEAEVFNLLGEKESRVKKKKTNSMQPVTHLKSRVTFTIMTDDAKLPVNNVPMELVNHLKIIHGKTFLPIVKCDFLQTRHHDLVKIMPQNDTVNITLQYSPVSLGKLRLLLHVEATMQSLKNLGFSDKDVNEVKGIFADTNIYILGGTFFIAAIHLLFDFLAFKNDVSYWRRKNNLVGLSKWTVVWRGFSQTIIFLYLLNEGSSLLVLIPTGIGSIIEIWKLKKVLKFKFNRDNNINVAEAKTRQFDAESMHYLSYLLYPLVIGGAIYSLLYQPHKSWYSWSINSLVNGVYAFGFLFMLPQLFVNYKLKSVAHLPWRTFMYKAFNTFIDDVFAFIISTPTAHRIACFRDDAVFLVYLYQRWLYPVDKSRPDVDCIAIKKRKYTKEDVYFSLKRWWAECCINLKKKQDRNLHHSGKDVSENLKIKHEDNNNSVLFYGTDQKGNSLFVKFSHRKFKLTEVSLQLSTSDGQLYVLPDYPDTTLVSSLNQEWIAGGLKIEFLEFQKRWRIVYNGMLRNLARGDNIDHVRLNFLFIESSYPLKWPEDWSSKLHAEVLASEPWSFKWINKIKLFDNAGFDQTGSMLGQITYKDASVSTMYLRGLHQHRWGKHEFHESVTLFVVMPLGDIYYLGVGSTKHSFPQLQFGQFKHSNEEVYEIEKIDFKLSDFTQGKFNANSTHKVGFEVDGKGYNIVVRGNDPLTLHYGQPWNWINKIATVKLEVNGKEGSGLIQLWSPYSGPCRTKLPKQLQFLKEPNISAQKNDYVLYFNDKKCQNESIVGGKGFSLAILTAIRDVEYVVPRGFCITVFALELQLNTYKELQEIISDIEDVSVGRKDGDLQKHCDEAMSIIQSTPLADKIKNAVLEAIENLESVDDDKSPRYAIRSSAVGEDSEETSAAGQNSTYLGVQGADNVIKSIAMCWASLFSYQSVKYRQQHGMFIKASMGVCVQKMVNPDAAGVMFTRHPTTGDPSNIIITANYGLGETVVSAAVEPDTIVVHKTWDNKLAVKSSTAGNKKEKILASGDGVVTVKLDDQESKTVCLPDKVALRLAAIGINLETLFGSGRDIEWAVIDEKIYLLQARPITTLYMWTEFELIHELGTGVPSDIDFNTFANVGEVFPHPMSPLTVSILPPTFNSNLNDEIGTKNQTCFSIFGMKNAINYYATFLRKPAKKITLQNKIVDIALSGKVVITPEHHRIACERNGIATARFQMLAIIKMIKEMIQNGRIERTAAETCKNLNLKAEEFSTAHSLYDEITRRLKDCFRPQVDYHSHASRVSISYQIFAMTLLTSGYTDFVPEHFSDIALLLSSCSDIIGTEVVMSLRKIITYIKKDEKDEEFKIVEPTKGIDWLKINCPAAAEELNKFLKEHGHRCIQEMDFISEPWDLRRENLIVTLQTMISIPETSSPTKVLSVEETITSLKTPKSAISRWLLRKITPLCRKAVTRRELTKSIFVNVIHRFRLAFRRLGKLMVLEEYIPSEDLIFFLTIEEIGETLNHRSAILVQKACRRKRIFPKLKELEYPEFNIGMPNPIKKSIDVPISDGNVKIEGTSVCGGSIVGRACVITDVSQANTIQHGDILITRSTDIAWSPYFSLLSGIVTELGGLISHGAVIAREYGLPCIVGANRATQFFRTGKILVFSKEKENGEYTRYINVFSGDTVLLVADTGTLQLVKKHE